jgi:hypothetical protein
MSDYRYLGIPFSSGLAGEIIEAELAGRTLKRDEIVRFVASYHIENGGVSGIQTNSQVVKKALNMLLKRGSVRNPSTGFWVVGQTQIEDDAPDQLNTVDPIEQKTAIAFSALETIGEGESAVYVYYLPIYKLDAEQSGRSKWPCKIGKTDSDPLNRILSQAATALPERPVVALVIRTDSSSDMEKALHSILTLRGQRIPGAPGTEWFFSNPDEIKELYHFIVAKPDC